MLTAVVVTYRTPAELAAALASLRAQTRPPDEIIVVDNGAADGTPLPAMDELDGARILRPGHNVGYGAGCNAAAAQAKGDELLFLNADVVLTAEACAELSDRLTADANVAVVGPRIYSGGRLQQSARAFPSLRTGVLGRRSVLTRLLVRARRYPAELRPAYGGGGQVDWVSGACMLVRRSSFDEIGGFDEGYWMYWEDADLCRRIADSGGRVYFEPAAIVHHATGASGVSERTIRAFHDSAARFAASHVANGPLSRALIPLALRAREWVVLRLTSARP